MNFKKRHPSDVSWNHIFHQCFTHIWHSWKVVKIETDEPNKRKFIECFSVISCYISCDHQKLILYSLLLMKILYLAFFLYYNHLLVGHPILWIYPISCLFCHFYAVRLPSVRMSFFFFLLSCLHIGGILAYSYINCLSVCISKLTQGSLFPPSVRVLLCCVVLLSVCVPWSTCFLKQ